MPSRARAALRHNLRRLGLLEAARAVRHPNVKIPRLISRHLCVLRARDITPGLRRQDASLWEESQDFAVELEARAQQLLRGLEPLKIGGGAAYSLLYFLTRLMRPKIAVETGVAAGWSTQAILAAMEHNERGRLYSSDLPYERPDLAESYEPYIGLLVDDNLKHRWELLVEGDRVNLPKIMSRIDSIDLFHYDSEKSSRGQRFALDTIESKLHPRSVIIVDDINDSLFWWRWSRGRTSVAMPFGSKFIGLVGPSDLLDPAS